MNNVERLVQFLKDSDASTLEAEGGPQTFPILRAIKEASQKGDVRELDRQASAFLSLSPKWYDAANVFLGYAPEPPVISPELLNEIQNATLAVLKEIEENKTNGKD